MSQPNSPLDTRAFRNALGRFATGITVVTALDRDGRPIGLTVNSFAAVSLEPALVLWSLANGNRHLEDFKAASHYGINVLAAEQTDISQRFATWPEDRFAGLKWQPGIGGVPVLAGCCATFEVRNELQYPGGDHLIFVGQVESFQETPDSEPLLFHGGRYRTLAST